VFKEPFVAMSGVGQSVSVVEDRMFGGGGRFGFRSVGAKT
jgi:hypothetical protein